MKKILFRYVLIFVILCLQNLGARAQICPESCDNQRRVLEFNVLLPMERADIKGNAEFKFNIERAVSLIQDNDFILRKIIVKGFTSPDGPLAYNEALTRLRTDNAVMALSAYGFQSDIISREYCVEAWGLLEDLLSDSEFEGKDAVIAAISDREGGDRKAYLKALSGGKVWKILLDDYFPLLRCVSLTFVCDMPEPVVEPAEVIDSLQADSCTDTLAFSERIDTVSVAVQEKSIFVSAENIEKWRIGLKTNLLLDAVAAPSLGLEFQLGNSFSFDVQGWWMLYNVLARSADYCTFYGVSPELRWWPSRQSMKNGVFIGAYGVYSRYSMKWSDSLVYQNISGSIWDGILDDSMDVSPAWSAGLSLGYALGFGVDDRWGVEFVVGAGYLSTAHDVCSLASGGALKFEERQRKYGFGLTKVGINLVYRFADF